MIDLMALDRAEWDLFAVGFSSGYAHGLEAGREQLDAELAALQRRAHAVVQAAARVPAWADAQETRHAAQIAACERHQQGAVAAWPGEQRGAA